MGRGCHPGGVLCTSPHCHGLAMGVLPCIIFITLAWLRRPHCGGSRVIFIVLAWTCCCCCLTMLVWMQCRHCHGLAMQITSRLCKVDVDALSASYRDSIFHAHFVAIVAASLMVAVDGPSLTLWVGSIRAHQTKLDGKLIFYA